MCRCNFQCVASHSWPLLKPPWWNSFKHGAQHSVIQQVSLMFWFTMDTGPRLCSFHTRDSGEAHACHTSQPLYLLAHAFTLLLLKKPNIQPHGRAIIWKKTVGFSFEKYKKTKECGDIDKFTVNEVVVAGASYRVEKNLMSWIMTMSRRKVGNCWTCFFPFTWIRVLHWLSYFLPNPQDHSWKYARPPQLEPVGSFDGLKPQTEVRLLLYVKLRQQLPGV